MVITMNDEMSDMRNFTPLNKGRSGLAYLAQERPSGHFGPSPLSFSDESKVTKKKVEPRRVGAVSIL